MITDGKPNDLDHYEGRHGIEDSRMAIREARRAGQAVYGIAIDAEARHWFPRLFGRGGFTVIPHPDKLTAALPGLYRQLVGESSPSDPVDVLAEFRRLIWRMWIAIVASACSFGNPGRGPDLPEAN